MKEKYIEATYKLTMTDLRDGRTVEDLEGVIKLLEEKEDYEGCAGIKRAIDEWCKNGQNEEFCRENT